jgi:hypothetical protein
MVLGLALSEAVGCGGGGGGGGGGAAGFFLHPPAPAIKSTANAKTANHLNFLSSFTFILPVRENSQDSSSSGPTCRRRMEVKTDDHRGIT